MKRCIVVGIMFLVTTADAMRRDHHSRNPSGGFMPDRPSSTSCEPSELPVGFRELEEELVFIKEDIKRDGAVMNERIEQLYSYWRDCKQEYAERVREHEKCMALIDQLQKTVAKECAKNKKQRRTIKELSDCTTKLQCALTALTQRTEHYDVQMKRLSTLFELPPDEIESKRSSRGSHRESQSHKHSHRNESRRAERPEKQESKKEKSSSI